MRQTVDEGRHSNVKGDGWRRLATSSKDECRIAKRHASIVVSVGINYHVYHSHMINVVYYNVPVCHGFLVFMIICCFGK